MKNTLEREKNFAEKLRQTASLTDQFEGYANPHARQIAALAEAVARKFHLAPHDCLTLQQAALVHDFGEFAMNRDYIKFDRQLTDEERIDMRRHAVIGEQEAAKSGLPRAVGLLVRWHHEWWNGTGYPDALEGAQIPLAARILRVADTYAALTSARPFRSAMTAEEAKKYLIEWAGIEFDPEVVKHFLALEELESFPAEDDK
ncbi:MAG: HD-GYP domain-containing protein [Pyrinomonadaceae bacterium]